MMNTGIKIKAGAAIFSVCAIMAFSMVHGANAADATLPSKKVIYGDLDISKPAGARVLYGRIVQAAHQVCEVNQFQSLATMRMVNRCIDRAIDNAVRDVGSPALTALRPSTWLKVASN
jgi:UrcA family protein